MAERKYVLKAERVQDGVVAYSVEDLTLLQAERMRLAWWGELYADIYEIYFEDQEPPAASDPTEDDPEGQDTR
jgi:hypothetical protein